MRPIGVWVDPTITQAQVYSVREFTKDYVTGTIWKNSFLPVTFPNCIISKTGYNSGPNWRQLRLAGLLPPRPAATTITNELSIYRLSNLKVRYLNGTQKNIRSDFSGIVSNGVSPNYDSIFGSKSSVIADLSTHGKGKLMKKISETTFTGSTVVAEGSKTLNWLGNTTNVLVGRVKSGEQRLFSQLRRDYRNIKYINKSGKRRRASDDESIGRQLVDIATSRWLEFQYGIKPLVNDVDSLLESAADLQYRAHKDKVSTLDTRNYTRSTSTLLGNSQGVCCIALFTYQRKIDVKYGGSLAPSTNFPNGIDPARKFGFDWASLAPAIWEAVPYSFLIDYFTNCGDVINSLSQLTKLRNFTQSWGVTLVEDSVEVTVMPFSVYNNTNSACEVTGVGEHYMMRSLSFNRIVNPQVIPLLQFKNWDTVSPLHWANITSLAAQFALRATGASSFKRIFA